MTDIDTIAIGAETSCYHCGEHCDGSAIVYQQHTFCCAGCQTVYELLDDNNLCGYYRMNDNPGSSLNCTVSKDQYAWLDDPDAIQRLTQFTDGHIATVTLYIPAIHCSSCIYLLENVHRLHAGFDRAKVNFLKREVSLTYTPAEISLRQVVETIAMIGYPPEFNLNDLEQKERGIATSPYYLKIGIAFFCFGNIMLLSFPEYLGISALTETPMRSFFGYANFLLSLPVLLFSAREFFVSAYTALRQRTLNMDIPIVLGMIAMFLRSSYEIFILHGAGYMDTLASLTLLMLIGRLFQNKTYQTLSFERDYKSYFPVSVAVIRDHIEQHIPLSKLVLSDTIIVRHQELVPADAILLRGEALIDYSFVTGESTPVHKSSGDMIYAGGRQIGSAIEMQVIKDVSHSYLTQLWNDAAFQKNDRQNITALATKVSRWFTPLVIAVALGAGLFWINGDIHRALNAFTAVLIITCPCALALSSPFTLGNIIRIVARSGIYLKNTLVIEKLAKVKSIVFDKTGTITDTGSATITYHGIVLTDTDLSYIKSVTYHSTHPLSKKLNQMLGTQQMIATKDFVEVEGKGIEAWIAHHHVRIGSASFALAPRTADVTAAHSRVHINIDGVYKGYYEIKNQYRKGFQSLIKNLQSFASVFILSGDNDHEKNFLSQFLPADHLTFNQQPADKLYFVKNLQHNNHPQVMMIGDGLNDAGALKQSDVGMAISDDTNHFSPACDGIIEAERFERIPDFLKYAQSGMRIIKVSLVISLLYNLLGLYFAVQGTMSPIIAAILMPLSSVTIISFTTLASLISGRIHGFK